MFWCFLNCVLVALIVWMFFTLKQSPWSVIYQGIPIPPLFFPLYIHSYTLFPAFFYSYRAMSSAFLPFFFTLFVPLPFPPKKKKKAWKFYIEKRPWCINVRENKTRRGAAAVVVVVMGADLFEPAPPSPPYSLTPYNPGVLPLGFSACFHIPYKARRSPRS